MSDEPTSPASPASPASPTSSVGSSGSFASAASAASTASTASTQKTTPITAKSQIVIKFARLFNELSKDDKKTYLDMLAYYIDTRVNNRFKTIGSTSSDSYRDKCYQTIFNNTLKITGGNCRGALIPNTHISLFFQGFAEFLQNFRFPAAPEGTAQPELSLPMLEFVSDSDLTSMLSYRADNNVNDIRKCTFKMGMVDKMSFGNIKYIKNTSVDTPDTPDAAAPPSDYGYDPLLEFLIKNNVVNKSLGYENNLMFNLGFIQKPTNSNTRPFVESLERESPHVNLCFRLNDNLITLVIDRNASSDGSRECNFKIIEVLTGGVLNRWTWTGKINDLKFYPTCQPSATASSGGRKRRRSSKTKKVRARSTRRRHNIKKLKRSVYVKAGNTKRKIRRFRH